jgi:probable F420-dependent oxidoreductase
VRFGIALPNYGPLASPETLGRLAERAAACGADSVWVSDHLVAPVNVTSVYPYDRRSRPTAGDMGVIEHFYEPLVTLAYLAGRVPRLRLGVSAYVMPYRNPVVTAKQVASLDALSGGRVLLAVGVGWLREEFAALGVPYDDRGRRTEEYLAVCKALWAGGEAHFEGRTYRLPPVRTGPLPVQRPHPPLWIAGNSPRAVGRAARIGDGWHAIDLAPDALASAVSRLHELATRAGRDPTGLTVSLRTDVRPGSDGPRPLCGDTDKIRRDLDAYARAGVEHVVASLPRVAGIDDAERNLEAVASALRAGA